MLWVTVCVSLYFYSRYVKKKQRKEQQVAMVAVTAQFPPPTVESLQNTWRR